MTNSLDELVLGTSNAKKGSELRRLLAPFGIRVAMLSDVPGAIDVAETAATFEENAQLKAVEQAIHLKRWVLADDSGIEVDALDGRPGVYSARYAGSPCDNDANNQKLLTELQGVPWERRGAQYVCVVVLADPEGTVRATCRGRCRGRIRTALAGANGFGYDPLFEVVEYHRTFGELGPTLKQAISHRGRALRGILPQLAAFAKRT